MGCSVNSPVLRITVVLIVKSFVMVTSQTASNTTSPDMSTVYMNTTELYSTTIEYSNVTLDTTITEVTSDEMTTLPDNETVAMTTEGETTTPEEEITTPTSEDRLWKAVRAKFTLKNKSDSDIGDELKNEIKTAIDEIFGNRFDNYNMSVVKGFASGSLIAFVELDFRIHMTNLQRLEVVKVLYEIVERNGTLGELNVENLFVKNIHKGVFERIDDACDINPCWNAMTCFSEGNDCRSTCSQNAKYCLNGATCIDNAAGTTFIGCRCEADFLGSRCEKRHGETYDGNDDLFVGIIAASVIAGIIVCAIVTATCINIMNKRRTRHSRSEELFGIENVVALELTDEKSPIEGIATQTDESFLLARSHKDGVPPKAGHAHKIMQTNDSFLLVKAQLLKAQGASRSRSKGAGSPVGVVSGNARRVNELASSKSGEKVATAGTSSSNGGANKVARKASSKKERAPQPPAQPAAVEPTDGSTESNVDELKSAEKMNGTDDRTTVSDNENKNFPGDSSGPEKDIDVEKNDPNEETITSDLNKNPSGSSQSLPSGRKILKV